MHGGFRRKLTILAVKTCQSKAAFMRAIIKYGADVSPMTYRNWFKPQGSSYPDMNHLWAIKQIEPDISIDWLLGYKDAETITEKYIEQQMIRTD